MNRATTIAIDRHSWRFWMIFLLATSLLVLACGDIFAGTCNDKHDDHCKDECRDCGDCLQCLPGIHMIPAVTDGSGPVSPTPLWLVTANACSVEGSNPCCIDHPPRTLV
ncbi:hypothetical protein GF420_00105 [candidate division GN15 bacterium]|nr:hypothetical protein [candidate division GN15 bacterium]